MCNAIGKAGGFQFVNRSKQLRGR